MKLLKNNRRKNVIINKQRDLIIEVTYKLGKVSSQLESMKSRERRDSRDESRLYEDINRMQEELNEYYELKDKHIKLLAALKIKGVEIEVK